ncbi:hypothetical protein LSH36_320g04085, partial [Paralvinella palmiformis]
PNDTYYDWKATIPADITHLGPQSEWPEEVRDLPDIEDLLVHTVFPDPRTTNRSGLYKIGIKLAGRMVDYDNPTNESSYSFLVFQSGCRYFNETTDSWETDGVT